VIDLHAHILPGLDDGPPSQDAAVEMARAAVAAGTRAMATTSHVDRAYGLRPADLAGAREALVARLAEEGIELELLQGGEVAADRLADLDDDTLRAVALGDGPAILLECPFSPVGSGMELMVAELRRRRFEVLLGHPERSPSFQGDLAGLERLIGLGATAQLTVGSLAGGFGGTVAGAAARMLEAGLVHVIASDAHDTRRRRPDLRLADAALHERYDDVEAQIAWMTDAAPAAILAGEPLPERPPLPRPPRRRGRLRRAWSAR
jgi:protein-tyrosine phosphatase